MTAFSAVKPSAIKLKVLPTLPASILGEDSLEFDRANGIVTGRSNYERLTTSNTIPNPSNGFVKMWDPANGFYKVTYNTVIAGSLDAAATAQAAAATATAAATIAVNAGGLTFPSLSIAMATAIPIGVNRVVTLAAATAGDHGEAAWLRTVGPAAPGKRQFNDGSWWKLDVLMANPYMLGAKGNGSTNDTAAVQELVDYLDANVCQGILPPGTYRVDNLRTKHSAQSDYIADAYNGWRLVGMGRRSILKGAYDSAPQAADYTNYLTASMGAQAVLSIYRSNVAISGIAIHGARVGIFMGQDPLQTSECSVVSNNIISDVWMERVGTAVLMQSGLAAPTSGTGQLYYNKLSNFHFINYNIGLHLAPWLYGINNGYPTLGNNNRNCFTNFRGSRGWCNYLLESADGNDFVSCYSENGTWATDGTSFVGTQPPLVAAWIGGNKAIGFLVLGQSSSNNRFFGGSIEAVDQHITDTGYKNHWFGKDANPALCNFASGTASWRGVRMLPIQNYFDTLSVGAGTLLSFFGRGSVTVAIGNVSAGAVVSSAASVTVAGAAIGDFVTVRPSNDFQLTYVGRVTGTNTITISALNSTNATVNATSQTLDVFVVR